MVERREPELNRARIEAGLSDLDLWMRYFELGGMGGELEIAAYVHGALVPSVHDHNVLAHALNERFGELGYDTTVPYCER